MAHNISVSGTATALNQYCTMFAPTIAQSLKQELEFEKMFPFKPCDRTYVSPNVTVTRPLQPYQAAFTSNNTETYSARENTLEHGKADLEFDQLQLEEFYDTWACNWFELGKPMLENSYARYVIETHIRPQLVEDMNLASWAGVRVDPTPGTAGTYLQTWTGFKKHITDALTAGDLTPIATGAPTAGAMVDFVRDFCAALPVTYRYKAGKIYMSATNAARYSEDYMEKYPRAQEVVQNPNAPVVRVDHYNKIVVGINAMEGSDRIFFSPDVTNNLIIGTRKNQPLYPVFRFQEFDRKLKVLSEVSRFYGWEFNGHMFVNDQA